jgi:hypothetical protein
MEDSIKKQLEDKVDFEAKRELREHETHGAYKAFTEVYSVLPADFLFKVLCAAAQTNLNEFTVSKDEYKVNICDSKLNFQIKGKALKDQGSCGLNVEITKVDENTCCVEFNKKSVRIKKKIFQLK